MTKTDYDIYTQNNLLAEHWDTMHRLDVNQAYRESVRSRPYETYRLRENGLVKRFNMGDGKIIDVLTVKGKQWLTWWRMQKSGKNIAPPEQESLF